MCQGSAYHGAGARAKAQLVDHWASLRAGKQVHRGRDALCGKATWISLSREECIWNDTVVKSHEHLKYRKAAIIDYRQPREKIADNYVGLTLNIQKMKIMASGPINSWEIDAETVETVADFILGGSKITADGDCSHEIKRSLLLGK